MAKKKRAVRKRKAAKEKRPARKKKVVKVPWSKRESNLLEKLFPDGPTAKIAARLGRPTDAVKKKAARMGLRKSKKYMKTLGRA